MAMPSKEPMGESRISLYYFEAYNKFLWECLIYVNGSWEWQVLKYFIITYDFINEIKKIPLKEMMFLSIYNLICYVLLKKNS